MIRFVIPYLIMTALLMSGCAGNGQQNTNIIHSPAKLAYKACVQKNNGDKSKCQKEKDRWLEREELELLDEDT